jgi:hypothetical protein
MKKFIDFCILFALYVTVNYINDDTDFSNKAGKIYYAVPSFARNCLIWLICPIFIPEYFIKQTASYKQIKKIMDSPEYQAQMAKTFSMFNF